MGSPIPSRRPSLSLATLVLTAICLVTAAARNQAPAQHWADPSTHSARFVTVARGITLEWLDWGGDGRAVVLLAGSGHTAHVFDDIAPKLTGCCHVYGLTRRGYGQSSQPSAGYEERQLADDLLRALDEAGLERPILIGHSLAGGEMTTLARLHPNRLGGLVYLDALSGLEDDPFRDAEWVRLQRQLPSGLMPQPACAPVDRSSFDAYRRTTACERGFALPESEWRQMLEDRAGRVGPTRTPARVSQAIADGQAARRDFSGIQVPILALHNGAASTDDLLAASGYVPRSDDERETIDRFVTKSRALFGRTVATLHTHVPDARIVYLPLAGHYLFLTREAEVVGAIEAFVSSLGSRPRD